MVSLRKKLSVLRNLAVNNFMSVFFTGFQNKKFHLSQNRKVCFSIFLILKI